MEARPTAAAEPGDETDAKNVSAAPPIEGRAWHLRRRRYHRISEPGGTYIADWP